ncbi:hypothetical protein [Anaeromyxobacter diazotrophicus]|uniref:DZANK-type domain-containing protein n=1 Tax=Anaeromyxobacter diazotrophicus TaxID=2590199 RepID=A0A7I9VR56_9BACT|nr:hypothetical protein [Anaeromyxobacter diazotrophicus]GEJ58447.1 hypothetical protein AMYX_31880 [Anaeromyxobacter diazotrophicus]
MARCPLCDHEQALGDACDVCGRALRGAGVVRVPVQLLEGLDPTGYASAPAPSGAAMPELEPTGVSAVPAVAGPREAWVEATAQEAVAVAVEPLEVERTSGDGERSPREAVVRCRYCGELVPEGEAFCLRCAMHIGSRASAPEAFVEQVRCRACGAAGSGERCHACGERLPEPEAG